MGWHMRQGCRDGSLTSPPFPRLPYTSPPPMAEMFPSPRKGSEDHVSGGSQPQHLPSTYRASMEPALRGAVTPYDQADVSNDVPVQDNAVTLTGIRSGWVSLKNAPNRDETDCRASSLGYNVSWVLVMRRDPADVFSPLPFSLISARMDVRKRRGRWKRNGGRKGHQPFLSFPCRRLPPRNSSGLIHYPCQIIWHIVGSRVQPRNNTHDQELLVISNGDMR
ncbi:hypothetical protein F5B22DRAFT_41636 [Xylaria bambusicola]|uniref:uncharacterized protein n=1 Tax=Xylaria bambusicola TaxID=326684 RepID=UPI0020072785|nr:uncharacterized protein F5B22DRAFT_41636 [Xylaria bambusicola]KAI0502893.1 hypothetical protein F5B22DRAFT_41636 [Xylaria bambusicola]